MSETQSQDLNSSPNTPDNTEASDASGAESLPQWACDLAPLPGKASAPLESWTVGAKYVLNCQGDYTERLSDKAQIQFSEESLNYTLHILSVRQSDHTQAQFVVTGYKPGEIKETGFKISDGSHSVQVAPMTWAVQSILQPNQQPKPYPPFGPFEMGLPLWYWLSWAGAFLVVALVIFGRIKKHLDRKRLLERLAAHNTALSPYNQFNKDLRLLMRRHQLALAEKADEQKLIKEYVEEVDKSFRLFLVRQFRVPALEWGYRDIMREMKKQHRSVYDEVGRETRRLLIELSKATKEPEKVSRVDCDQLVDMSRRVADRAFKQQRRSA